MKKLLILCFLTSFFGLYAGIGPGSVSIINHANCDCTGKIEVNYIAICPETFDNPNPWEIKIDGPGGQSQTLQGDWNLLNMTQTVDNLCPGEYIVLATFQDQIVIDGVPLRAIMVLDTIIINGPDQFLSVDLIEYGPIAPDCYGSGFVNFNVNGGTEPLSYSWTKDGSPFTPAYSGDGNHTGLTGGSYTVTVTDANGCEKTISFTIAEQAPEIDFDVSTVNPGCDGDVNSGQIIVSNTPGCQDEEVWLIPSNGDPPSVGTEVNGEYIFNDLAPGIYTVRVRCDYGLYSCHEDKVVELTMVQPPLITDFETYSPGCNAQESLGWIEVSISSGTPPYSYDWSHNGGLNSNRAEDLPVGIYTVTVTDANGCASTMEITLEEVPTLEFSVKLRVVRDLGGNCLKSIAQVEDLTGTPPYQFDWEPGIDDVQTNEINEFPAVHTVTVTDANGCTETMQVTNECVEKTWMEAWANPNPTSDFVTVDLSLFEVKDLDIDVHTYDFTHNLYHSSEGILSPGNYQFPINVSSYTPGVYIITLTFDSNYQYSMLLLIQ